MRKTPRGGCASGRSGRARAVQHATAPSGVRRADASRSITDATHHGTGHTAPSRDVAQSRQHHARHLPRLLAGGQQHPSLTTPPPFPPPPPGKPSARWPPHLTPGCARNDADPTIRAAPSRVHAAARLGTRARATAQMRSPHPQPADFAAPAPANARLTGPPPVMHAHDDIGNRERHLWGDLVNQRTVRPCVLRNLRLASRRHRCARQNRSRSARK
jgi:hypothetical protein